VLISDVMTHAEVANGAIPEFFFHRRGG